jgi:hypothetical protein
MEHVVCICMYINTVANSVMLHLQHDFYSVIFKIKQPPLQGKILGAHVVDHN